MKINKFSFYSCKKIFLDLPNIFYGVSSYNLKNMWIIRSGALPPGIEILNNGVIFGFAPIVYKKTSYCFTIENKSDLFSIEIHIIPTTFHLKSKVKRKNTFTKNNYFQYGYGKHLSETNNKNDAFYIKIMDIKKHLNVSSGFNEAVKSARYISEKYNNLSLCFSGGVDSLAVLMAFLYAKIDFEIYIWKDKNNLIIDTDAAIQICRKHGLKYKIIEIDVIQFFESGEYIEYCKKYHTFGLIEMAMHIKFIENIPGTPITSSDPAIRSTFNPFVNKYYNAYKFGWSNFICLDRYFRKNNRDAVTQFIIYSVEQLMSLIQSEQTFYHQDQYYKKCEIYKLSGFPFNTHYTEKYFGNEKIIEFYKNKTGDELFFDKYFRYKAYFFQNKMEPRTAYTIESDKFMYFPENIMRDWFFKHPTGFKYYLRG